jgi:crotonobetainyl-CoA:carnitine CoA-transferase CaiB-like acyl-CoA transferase
MVPLSGPLVGLKVLDVGTVLAAPVAGTLLADLGAEVVKIEHPVGDSLRRWGVNKEGAYLLWKVVNRNQKAITLNLSKPKGQDLFRALAKDVDIVIENFRPGTMARWNIAFEALREINPGIVMVSISGWGQNGPYSRRPGYGTLAEGLSGFAQLNGPEDGPPTLPPVGMADGTSGLFAAYAALAAVYNRDVAGTKRGQHVDISLYESLFTMLGFTNAPVTQYDQLGVVPQRMGNRTNYECPRNLYRTRDDRWISISSTNESMARRIFTAMELEAVLDDPRFKDNDARLKNMDEVDSIVSGWMSKHDSKEILDLFEKNEATAGIVYDVKDQFGDEHFRARGNIITVTDPELGPMKMHGVYPVFPEMPGTVRHSGLPIGSDNKEIYCGRLGLSEEELESLRRDDVI